MVRKILCPTDFSEAAENGLAYAAKIAQLFKAELILLNVRPKTIPLTNTFKQYESLLEHTDKALKETCDEISRFYKISCAEEVLLSDQSIEAAIKTKTDAETILVLGTKGTDTLFEAAFGSHAYHIAGASSSPVWLVPENTAYGSVQNILILAQDQDDFPWELLKPILALYQPQITFLELPEMSAHNKAKNKPETGKGLADHITVSYLKSEPGRESASIQAEIMRIRPDILVIGYQKRRSVFSKDILKRLTRHPSLPMLVLPY